MQNSSSARFLFLDQDMQGIDLLKLQNQHYEKKGW